MPDYTNQGYLFLKHGKFSGKVTPVCPHCGQSHEHRLDGFWKERNGRKDELISLAVKTEAEHKEAREKEKQRKKGYEYEGPITDDEMGQPVSIEGNNPELNDIPF